MASKIDLPQSYVLGKLRAYSSAVKETHKFLNGSCPVCREGGSWGVKRRMFYMFRDEYIFCHNCQRSWSPYFWIKEVCGLTFRQIVEELKDENYDMDFVELQDPIAERKYELPPLPGECVNLRDELQVNYFKKNPIVAKAKAFCERRRLFTAAYAPVNLYCCIGDNTHRNRLVIPFTDNRGKVVSYITRTLNAEDSRPKYLMKTGDKKPIFNLHRVENDYPVLFLFEGQIDSMFVRNGVAVSGVYLTTEQDETLTRMFPFHQRYWVLDNYRLEGKEVQDVIAAKLKKNENVFLYDGEFKEFKDLNEYCVKKEQDRIDPALIIEGCYSGAKGLFRIGD